jgi:prevent-host-death family protein
MIEATATDMARAFHDFLGKVQHGETVIVSKHGKTVARLIPDAGFMPGKRAAALFRSYKATEADRQAAEIIATEIQKLDTETDHALAD